MPCRPMVRSVIRDDWNKNESSKVKIMGNKPRVFIDGEHGTTGLGIANRLMGRDDVELMSLSSENRKSSHHRAELINSVDVAILCLPDDAAREAVALIRNPAVRVIDASTAHRVSPDWTYGFPELTTGQRQKIREAKFVSNPGCYATGAIALIRPLIEKKILSSVTPLSIIGVSGYTGGGKSLIKIHEEEINPEPFAFYGVNLSHKHIPEIMVHGQLTKKPIFLPSAGHFPSGMVVVIPLHKDAVTGSIEIIQETFADWYRECKHITVDPLNSRETLEREDYIRVDRLANTDQLELMVFCSESHDEILLVARLDNLGKGASGAAIQNLNLMLGLNPG